MKGKEIEFHLLFHALGHHETLISIGSIHLCSQISKQTLGAHEKLKSREIREAMLLDFQLHTNMYIYDLTP